MNKQAESVIPGALVTGNVTINAQMPMGKSITISGYLYDGESVQSACDRINAFHDLVDFQRTRSEIPELEAKHNQMTVQLGQMKEALAELEVKKHAGKLSSQEKQMIENMSKSIVKINEELAKGEKAIAEAKAKVGM